MFRIASTVTSKSVFASVCLFVSLPLAAQNPAHADLLKLIAAPLPAGAVAQGAPSFYGPDNLYQYMDGGADIFVLYGVRTLQHLDARAKAIDLTVDVFDMGTPEAAFGMYAAERSPEYQFVSIGAEGYQNTGILNFVQDRYYVKLAGFGDGADAALDTWARALSSRIGGDLALPQLFAHLPAARRKPHSEQYIPADPLGHPFLGPAYVAAYDGGARESKLFVTVARDEADARDRLRQLKEHFAKAGQCAAAPEVGIFAIRGSNSFEGEIIAETHDRYLVMLLNPAAGDEQFLRSVAEGLK